MPFTHSVPVRFNDCDGMRHVNNAIYLTYIEDARIAFFASMKSEQGATFIGRGLIVARTEVDYVKPVLFARGPVVVSVGVESIGNKSFRLGYVLTQDGDVVARSVTVQVAYDYQEGKSRSLDDIERALLEKHLTPVS